MIGKRTQKEPQEVVSCLMMYASATATQVIEMLNGQHPMCKTMTKEEVQQYAAGALTLTNVMLDAAEMIRDLAGINQMMTDANKGG